MEEYPIKNRRKPRKKDGYHILLCIAKAVDQRFHVSPEFFGISLNQYNNFFEQLIKNDCIEQCEEGEYCAERFNITPKGYKFYKNRNIELIDTSELNLGIWKAEHTIKRCV